MKTGYEIREGSVMLAERFGTLPARRPARHSQCERILEVLRDGKLHTTAEIHERAGFSRLNSRIAELRKRGWNIQYEFVGGVGPAAHAYRLICAEDSSVAAASAVSPPSSSSGATSSAQTLFGAAA